MMLHILPPTTSPPKPTSRPADPDSSLCISVETCHKSKFHLEPELVTILGEPNDEITSFLVAPSLTVN